MDNQLTMPFLSDAAQGVKTSYKDTLLGNFTPCNIKTLSLANLSLKSLNVFFDKSGHNPNSEMWNSLTRITQTMEDMVEGSLAPKIYVSSLDPGIGKTQSIIHFIKVLLRSTHRDKGVIICVSRLNEVKSLIKELDLPEGDVGVLTSNKEINALAPSSGMSPVLITTQQRLELRCKGGSFENVAEFHYRGKPRRLRIWDEAILPGQPITLNRDNITFLFAPLRSIHSNLADSLELLFTDLGSIKDGGRLSIPNFEEEQGVGLNDILRLLNDKTDEQKSTAEALWYLSGRLVTVRKDGLKGNTMLDYRETLPEDLAPMLVLDASARVRETYPLWEENRDNLVRLPDAVKQYDNLNLHVWKRGGGKHSFNENYGILIEGIVNTANLRPNEHWLIVHHKKKGSINVEKQVRKGFKGPSKNLHFVTWGDHSATNAYKDISNVILAGTLFYRTSYYEALGRLSANLQAIDGNLTPEQFKGIMVGEHKHLILQALCRGSVRKSEKGGCAPCNAYVIASVKSGIHNALPEVFPGSQIKPWKPVKVPLKGKVAEAVKCLSKRLSDPTVLTVPFKEVMEAINLADVKNFRKDIRRHADFIDAIAQEGIIEHGTGKYCTHFALDTEMMFTELTT
jgi:hypothetical protein